MTKQKTDNDNEMTDQATDDQPIAEETAQVSDDFRKMEGKMADLENQLKRAVADYRNLEKRVEDGRSQLNSWASTELINKLLPVLDHLETVVGLGKDVLAERPELKDWFRGVELAVSQFTTVLKDEGVEEVSAEGQFNPSLHEAVDAAEGEDNLILRVAAKGYNLNGKVLRPAKVVVGKKGADQ